MKRKSCYICGKPITSEDSVSYGLKTGEISHLRCQLKSDGFDNSFLNKEFDKEKERTNN